MLIGIMPTLRPCPMLVASALVAAASVALLPGRASADDPACDAWEVEYALSANLQLRDTPMGEGDGIYRIGPGSVVVRFEDRGGRPGGSAKMLSYRMREYFQITSKTLFWTTSVTTDTRTDTIPDQCAVVAEGKLVDRVLRWSTPVRGYHTDGTLTCDGSLCGKFGAPPPGRSELHIPPGPVQFSPFQYSADLKTFTMANTFVSKTSMPKQTGYVALAGREMRHSCVPIRECR